jgi:D-arabinose 1-dehydrogenase-like Zn-dependent alcohol dehydrogenase
VLGARVIAVDVEDAKLDLARALGADLTVNARTTDPVEAIAEYGGADAAVVIAEPRHLEDVNACFDEVLAGHVPARLVFTF